MKLSVVMAVYNGGPVIARTLDSILGQSERDFELIVVDDGSTDETAAILADYARRDGRIRVLTQANAGLTRALIRGCGEARAPIIARHDCGDVSLPRRFEKQVAALDDESVVLVSCWTRLLAPEGELLSETREEGDAIAGSLRRDGLDRIRSISHHGTAMFRTSAYRNAGGYREPFRYAQDIDLWMRLLAGGGRVAVVPEVLYEATYSLGAISASRRDEQIELTKIAMALRDGGPPELLRKAQAIAGRSRPASKSDDARALYFIASCLRRNGDMRYKHYARAAVRRDPLHLRAWLLLLR